jgi:hypothetical protein
MLFFFNISSIVKMFNDRARTVATCPLDEMQSEMIKPTEYGKAVHRNCPGVWLND